MLSDRRANRTLGFSDSTALAPVLQLPVAKGDHVIRVVLAEDNLLMREGISALIDRHDDLDLVGTCGDLDALLAMVQTRDPEVVVTDIRMPPNRDDEGIRAAAYLRDVRPDIGVVVLSQFLAPVYAVSLLEGGAAGRGYLLKDSLAELDQLPSAVRTVAAGGSVIDAAVVDALVTPPRPPRRGEIGQLTERERDVLAEVAKGRSNAAIGAALLLGERAVEKHINSILTKLGLHEDRDINRRVKAVLLYLSAGDVDST